MNVPVAHQIPSPSLPITTAPSPKESSRGIVKELLNNLKDEMICPMLGSKHSLGNKCILTFMTLDAKNFCRGNHSCIHDPNENELLHSILAYLVNPCGHTFCCEYGWQWIKRNVSPLKCFSHCVLYTLWAWQRATPVLPSCVICWTSLSIYTPTTPNLVVNNTVEKYIEALHTNGIDRWEINGTKFQEWQIRKE